MEFIKGNLGKQGTKEGLPHSSNEIVIGLTESPAGKPCIGMTFGEKNWILYTTKPIITSDILRRQLHKELGVTSLLGLPFDWSASLKQQKLVLHEEDPSKLNKQVGIFVPADRFDDLISHSVGT